MEDKTESNTKFEKNAEKNKAKKTYQSPHFQVYGSLNRLTQAKPGTSRDGGPGSPNTKR